MSEIPLPPGLQWAPAPTQAPPAPDQGDGIPALPPGLQWQDYPGRGGISVHPSEKMRGPEQSTGTGLDNTIALFTGEGRATDPATKQPYREIRDLVAMLPRGHTIWDGRGGIDDKSIESMLVFEPDEMKRAEWIAGKFPGAKVRQEGREIIVNVPGVDPKTGKPFGDFTMNKIGWSRQDADDIASEGMLMGPAARAAGWGSSLVRRALAGGAATGATEGVRQGISTAIGARKDISLPDVAMAAGAGTILGGLSEAGFNLLRRAFATNALTTASGTMSPRGRLILERIGVDPDLVTLETLLELQPLMARASSPEEALRLAQAKSLDVPLTRGDVSRDPKAGALEQRVARGGTYGTMVMPSERRLFDLKKAGGEQDAALSEALAKTSQRVSGKPTEFAGPEGVLSTAQGSTFERTQQTLSKLYERTKANVSRHYERAKAGDAAFEPNTVSPLSRDLQKIKEGTNVPQAHQIADEVADEIKKAIAGGTTPISLNRMELIRQKISELGASSDPMVRQMGGQLRRAYAQWEQSLTPDKFVKGDPEAVASFIRGRKLRTEQAAKFEDDPAISAILKAERMPPSSPGGKPSYKLDINPSEAVDVVLGAGLGKRGAADTAQRLKNVLGADSEAWMSFKREVFARIAEKGAGTFEKRWATFQRDNPELANVVFTQGNKADLSTMASVSGTTRPVPGAVNHSGTAYELARQLPLSNVGSALVARSITGVTPGASMTPLRSPRAPLSVRGGAVATAEDQQAPDAAMVARYLRSFGSREGAR